MGRMRIRCRHCGAMHFDKEVRSGRSICEDDAEFVDCCYLGRVKLAEVKRQPPVLEKLLSGNHGMSSNFLKNIRKYNGALAFASVVSNRPPVDTGYRAYAVHGQVYHFSGDLLPFDGKSAQFAQLYILDADEATEQRMKSREREGCDAGLMKMLADIIVAISPLANSYKMMKRVLDDEEQRSHELNTAKRQVVMTLGTSKSYDRHRHNIPAENEIAAVFVSDDGEIPGSRGLMVYPKSGQIKRIPVISEMVDPMSYPLLFPHGDAGWCPDMKLTTEKRMSICQYYSYRIACHPDQLNLQKGGKLWQQYVVDAYCKVEECKLSFLRRNQKALRAESYSVLNYSMGNENPSRVGRRVILPSSFIGGPRSQQQHFQDSMSIVSAFGKPDLFVTFTCNPNWREIQDQLLPGQNFHDRPEIVARVFRLKLDELQDDLFKRNVLGKCDAHVGVIEFQKRGLPHAHILLTLCDGSKFKTARDIDKVVSATIPDPQIEPRLYSLVGKHMVHGPCGEINPGCPCMREQACTKRYPKQFSSETKKCVNGYPLYCRPNNQRTITVGRHSVDNQWIVPYNKYLLLKYNSHINVEVCSSLKSIKYLHKYIHKGPDAATVRITVLNNETVATHDEIEDYVETRYIGSPEAAWRLLKNMLHFKSHSIQRLSVHKEDEKTVIYEEGNEEEALASADEKITTLEAFFVENQRSREERNGLPPDPGDEHDSRNLLYAEMPLHFVFNSKKGWSRRQKNAGKTLGRMYFVSPKDTERYYLRMLLLHRKGANSFTDLKTVNDTVFETFKDAANAMGLVSDDREYDNVLMEAAEKYTPSQIRHLFSNLLIFCNPSNPQTLWDKHCEAMSDDIFYRTKELQRSIASAYEIVNTIIDGRYPLSEYVRIPEALPVPVSAEDIWMEHEVDHIRMGEQKYDTLNTDQKNAADRIMIALENECPDTGRCFFIDGPGGSGKTYLYETLNHLVKAKGFSVKNVAWSGIAAQLLPRGTTVHSAFKLPVPVNHDNYMPFISAGSPHANDLLNTDVYLWDEAPMSPRYAVEGVDEFLRDITQINKPFGGKLMILGGDFRQIPPVVRGKATATLETSLKRSTLWPLFEIISLKKNVRATNDDEFAEFLLKVGDGKISEDDDGYIELPQSMKSDGKLIEEVYGDTLETNNISEVSKRAILCPRNRDCLQLNQQIIRRLPGQSRVYYSVDTACVEDSDGKYYPSEFLNNLTPSGMFFL